MRSELCLAALVALGGCSLDWDGLRPLQGVDAAAPPTDAVTAPDAVDAPAVADAADATVAADAVDAAATEDVVDAPATEDIVDAPATEDVITADVVDVPAPMDIVDAPASAPDAVDVVAPRDIVDVQPDRVDVVTPVDTGPACTGLSCPCVAGNPTGYCRVGEQCVGGACASTTVAGALVITEVMNDADGAVTEPEGEWIEVYNPAAYAVDIRGMRVRDAAASAALPTAGPALLVLPRGYAVLARTPNLGISAGPVLALATYDSVSLNNSGTETVTLATEAGAQIDSLTYGSGWPSTPGRSKSLRPGILDAVMNDTSTNWCAGGPMYTAMNFGTPAAANGCQ